VHKCPCNNTCASRVPIFQGLTPHELGRFNDILTTREYPDSEIIYTQDSPAQVLCIVNSGAVKLFKTSPEGKEQVLRILSPGDFFGEAVLFSQQTRTSSAQALGPTKICQLDKSQAEEIIQRHPEIARKLIAALNLRLAQAEEQIEYLGTRTTLQRVARLVVDLAREQGDKIVTLPLSREGLASLTGMTVENFSRKLSELTEQGLITPQGRRKLVIKDLESLEKLT
jgi:CRP-like cAMP-binding protein